MCFSAGASFGAATVLSLAGAGAMAGAQTKAHRLFAAIPMIFSLQQVMEGMLWLSQKNEELRRGELFFTYGFLFFALILWPVYIPYSVWLLEKAQSRKNKLGILLMVGSAASICFATALIIYPVNIVIAHHHIHFDFVLPAAIKNLLWLVNLFYLMATIAAPIISGIKRMKWLGIGFLATYIFSLVYFRDYLVSVWCYFAAALSLMVVWIMRNMQKN